MSQKVRPVQSLRKLLTILISFQLGIGLYIPSKAAAEPTRPSSFSLREAIPPVDHTAHRDNQGGTPDGDLPPILPDDPRADEIAKFESELRNSRSGTPARIPDVFGLTGQYRIEYAKSLDNKTQIGRRIPLDRYQIGLALDVGIVNLNQQMSLGYEAAQGSFLIQIRDASNGNGNTKESGGGYQDLIFAHEFTNVGLVSTLQDSVIRDTNVMLMATNKGIEIIYLPVIERTLLRASIARYVVPASGQRLAALGGKIEKIEFVRKNQKLSDVIGFDGKPLPFVSDHDVLCTIRMKDGNIKRVALDYVQDIILPLAPQMIGHMMQLQAANPNLEFLPELLDLVKDEKIQRLLQEHQRVRDQLLVPTEDATSSDLLAQAQVNAALRTDVDGLMFLFRKNGDGGSKFDQIRSRTRDLVPVARPGERSQWSEEVLNAAADPGPEVKAAVVRAERIEELVKQKFTSRVFEIAKRFITPATAFALGAAVAGDFAIQQTGGPEVSWILATIGHYMEWSLNLPVIGQPLQDAVNSQFFMQNWTLTRFVSGVTLFASLRPLLYMLSHWHARRQGHDWSEVVAFFTYGLRFCARVSYPFQALILEKLARQKHLYKGLVDGIRAGTPGLMNAPWALDEKIRANENNVNLAVEREALVKQRALLTAAALISQKAGATDRPMDPILLLELFSADQVGKADFMIETFGTQKADQAWLELLINSIYKAYAQLPDNHHAGPVNEEMVKVYLDRMMPLYERFYNRDDGTPKTRDARIWVKSKWNTFAKFTSKQILPWILFGEQGYKLYVKYKNAVIDERNASTGATQYNVDYPFGNWLYGMGIPQGYGFGSLSAFITAAMNQTQQPIIYGVLNGLNAVQTHDARVGLDASVFRPEVSTQLNRGSLPSDEKNPGFGRQMSWVEAFKVMGNSIIDVQDPASVLQQQQQMMTAVIEGFQVRIVSTVAPWIIGLTVMGFTGDASQTAQTIGIMGAITGALEAIPKYSTVWLDKYTYSSKGLGYAVIWIPIQAFMNSMKNRAQGNLTRVERADVLIAQGLSERSLIKLRIGVREMLALYRQGDMKLRQDLQLRDANDLDSQSFDELAVYARSLAEFAKTNPPLATVANETVAEGLNLGGSVISTALFVTFTNLIIGGNIWVDLPEAMAVYAAFLLGGKTIINLEPKIKQVAKQAWQSCQALLGGK